MSARRCARESTTAGRGGGQTDRDDLPSDAQFATVRWDTYVDGLQASKRVRANRDATAAGRRTSEAVIAGVATCLMDEKESGRGQRVPSDEQSKGFALRTSESQKGKGRKEGRRATICAALMFVSRCLRGTPDFDLPLPLHARGSSARVRCQRAAHEPRVLIWSRAAPGSTRVHTGAIWAGVAARQRTRPRYSRGWHLTPRQVWHPGALRESTTLLLVRCHAMR